MKRGCSVGRCSKKHHARGMCSTHYTRSRLGQQIDAPVRRRRRSTAAAFWADVDQSGGPDACWPWTGTEREGGYGRAFIPGVGNSSAHLAAWFWTHGQCPPPGTHLDHTCHTADVKRCSGGPECPHRRCCNPTHLEQVTPRENTYRSNASSRFLAERETCDKGHPFSGDNVVARGDRKGRKCRTCHAEYMREWRKKRPAA